MVRYLAESLDVYPAARRNLERILENDSSERIRVYLARKLLGPVNVE